MSVHSSIDGNSCHNGTFLLVDSTYRYIVCWSPLLRHKSASQFGLLDELSAIIWKPMLLRTVNTASYQLFTSVNQKILAVESWERKWQRDELCIRRIISPSIQVHVKTLYIKCITVIISVWYLLTNNVRCNLLSLLHCSVFYMCICKTFIESKLRRELLPKPRGLDVCILSVLLTILPRIDHKY